MKMLPVRIGVLSTMMLFFFSSLLHAIEQGGLLVEISKKVVRRNDKVTVNGVGNMSVDRDMALKLDIKNSSNKEFPETPVDSVILVQRWVSETANVERYTGTAKIPAMHPAQTTSVNVGLFNIGGHMHGSSDMHVDKVLGWKVTLMRDGQKLEFSSSPSFDTMNRHATPAPSTPAPVPGPTLVK